MSSKIRSANNVVILLMISMMLIIFLHSGVIKHQVNLDTHTPGCRMPRNQTNRSNTSHVVWCSEDTQFQADKQEVQLNLCTAVILRQTDKLAVGETWLGARFREVLKLKSFLAQCYSIKRFVLPLV